MRCRNDYLSLEFLFDAVQMVSERVDKITMSLEGHVHESVWVPFQTQGSIYALP